MTEMQYCICKTGQNNVPYTKSVKQMSHRIPIILGLLVLRYVESYLGL
jgi:hypothetical protein